MTKQTRQLEGSTVFTTPSALKMQGDHASLALLRAQKQINAILRSGRSGAMGRGWQQSEEYLNAGKTRDAALEAYRQSGN